MPTDSELITTFTNLSADAREVLEGLRDLSDTNGNVTFALSGGSTITVRSFQALRDDFYEDAYFAGDLTITRDASNRVTLIKEVLAGTSGEYIETAFTYSGTSMQPSTVTETHKDSGGSTIQTKSWDYNYDSNNYVTSITEV